MTFRRLLLLLATMLTLAVVAVVGATIMASRSSEQATPKVDTTPQRS